MDGTDYTSADESAGAIYSPADLTFRGKGSLIVNGNTGDAIIGKDDMIIRNGNLMRLLLREQKKSPKAA